MHSLLARAVRANMPRAKSDLAHLVSCRSVFNPAVEPVAECVTAASLTESLLSEIGMPVTATATPDGSLAVLARARGKGPAVLLYTHHDVVPAGPLEDWDTNPWVLTERGGRWYGRGAADCKGNVVAVLTALRAVRDVVGRWPLEIAVVVEGSEEQSTGGMEALARKRPELLKADVVVLADTGNIALGQPTLTTTLRGTGSVRVTVDTMSVPAHSGMFGGAAPDALQALVTALATLRGPDGETTIDGLAATGTWAGAPYSSARFVHDAHLVDGVLPLSEPGEDVPAAIADRLWARPAATVLAIDAPRVDRLSAAIQGRARAVVNLRVPPGMDSAAAQQLLIQHLKRHTPYGRVTVEPLTLGAPFEAATDGPAYAAMRKSMRAAFGVEPVTTGQGGSIPLAVAVHELHPDAEILLLGVEEPQCRIHSPNESVDPAEIERTALALALFLTRLAGLTDDMVSHQPSGLENRASSVTLEGVRNGPPVPPVPA